MKTLIKLLFGLFLIGLTALLVTYLLKSDIAVIDSKGLISNKQRDLMFQSVLLMLVIVIPVLFMAFWFAWRYREGNKTAKYTPEWDTSKVLETIWWGVPIIIISILSVMTWKSSHELDPFKPLDSSVKPVTVQVIALQWKWLFIYPEQNIASLNYLQIPQNTPINFQITSDAPMNSFWIPKLGGQIYAMAGMKTKLHLQANEVGNFVGYSANLSGEGFADMQFVVRSSTTAEFDSWVRFAKLSGENLSLQSYNDISQPSIAQPTVYASSQKDLYDTVVMKYMVPYHHAQALNYKGSESVINSGEGEATSGHGH